MKIFKVLIFGAIAGMHPAAANSQTTNLQCDGRFSNWEAQPPVVEVPVTGLSIRIDLPKRAVHLATGLTGLDGQYPIITDNENGIGFRIDAMSGGFINRLTGKLSINGRRDEKNLRWLLTGDCAPARRLF